MRKWSIPLILGLLATPAIIGCGTMGNLGGTLSLTHEHFMEPYGGVKLCLEGGTKCFKESDEADKLERVLYLMSASYVFGLDLPMSVVADTLTLPLTVKATLRGEAHSAPVRWGGRDDPFRLRSNASSSSSNESLPKLGPIIY